MSAQTTPQDPQLWAMWEQRRDEEPHSRSPRRVTVDGRWQRWCSCGWQGELHERASGARAEHARHAADALTEQLGLKVVTDFLDESRSATHAARETRQ